MNTTEADLYQIEVMAAAVERARRQRGHVLAPARVVGENLLACCARVGCGFVIEVLPSGGFNLSTGGSFACPGDPLKEVPA
jgi:hypothetical protein